LFELSVGVYVWVGICEIVGMNVYVSEHEHTYVVTWCIHILNVYRGYVNEKVKRDYKGDTQWNSYVYDDIWGLRELWVKEIKEKGLKLLVTMPL